MPTLWSLNDPHKANNKFRASRCWRMISSWYKSTLRGWKQETNPHVYLRFCLLIPKMPWSFVEIRPTMANQSLAFPSVIPRCWPGQTMENISFTCPANACKRKTERRGISRRGKTLVTAGNTFLMVVRSEQRGRQMPLVKRSYLFCPWKRSKNNKSILNKEQHDLMPPPVFLCLRWLQPPSTRGHYGHTSYSQEPHNRHTQLGGNFSTRALCEKPHRNKGHCWINPKKRFNFIAGMLMERKQKHWQLCCLDFAGRGEHEWPLTCA